jgi:hypothetical protein
MPDHEQEADAIAASADPPTFENTIVALERSGQILSRVTQVFNHLKGADTNPEIQAIERTMAPRLSPGTAPTTGAAVTLARAGAGCGLSRHLGPAQSSAMNPTRSKEIVPSKKSACWAKRTGSAPNITADDPSPRLRCIDSKQRLDPACVPGSGPTNNRRRSYVLMFSTLGSRQNVSHS